MVLLCKRMLTGAIVTFFTLLSYHQGAQAQESTSQIGQQSAPLMETIQNSGQNQQNIPQFSASPLSNSVEVASDISQPLHNVESSQPNSLQPSVSSQQIIIGGDVPNIQTSQNIEQTAPNTAQSLPALQLANGGESASSSPQINASVSHDLSPIGMFLAADWVVKSVMIGLALASVATWTIWLVKTVEISSAKRKARIALHAVNYSGSLSELSTAMKEQSSIGADLVLAAEKEVQASLAVLDEAGVDGLKERLGSVLSRLVAGAGRRMSFGTGPLATIGAISPFVGLFGTVWGIMNSFIGISQAHTTNLAVVAPGIAEALLATAIGLVAAIPAVIIYNIFARSITGYRQQLVDVSAGIERLVSRDLDYRKVRQKNSSHPNLSIAAE
ncbi:tonB-system energizer ExbB [Bartonella tamiae]|uniref:Biopolymer transport protein ExbB n=1 Tax=Bartonella tamiae Th239 TaxID=1094558 RepID=J0ZSH8_9HYPH|nr:tonB-system energizer ExbB [Bartonella tamiae]EJF91723.1 tonB-system energizer ExbB [Bartonella tamiae Th239]EJF92609.1 tonB-system energizer ExbB [Bartonella tamiae Th307]